MVHAGAPARRWASCVVAPRVGYALPGASTRRRDDARGSPRRIGELDYAAAQRHGAPSGSALRRKAARSAMLVRPSELSRAAPNRRWCVVLIRPLRAHRQQLRIVPCFRQCLVRESRTPVPRYPHDSSLPCTLTFAANLRQTSSQGRGTPPPSPPRDPSRKVGLLHRMPKSDRLPSFADSARSLRPELVPSPAFRSNEWRYSPQRN